MSSSRFNRREFVRNTVGIAAAGAIAPYIFTSAHAAEESKNDRHVIGCIGTGDRWRQVVGGAMKYGDVVAVCDVDRKNLEEGNQKVGGKAEMFEDYRKVLDNKKIDVVTIVTPDHWHSKIAIEAMKAGKDVYCEKPLTLTIDEGKLICKVQKETGRVFQVGTQQRSEMSAADNYGKRHPQQFLTAVAIAQSGRLGKIQKVTCSIGGSGKSKELPKVEVPKGLNWEMWLGQAPLVDYVSGPTDGKGYPQSRCHYEFRWWYEYSGGKMTDWGAHHVDIAQWAIGMEDSGPVSVDGKGVHPVPFKNGYPTVDNQYNAALEFKIACKFPNDVEMIIQHGPNNGIWIKGDKAEIFVSRSELKDVEGTVIKDLTDNQLPAEAITKLYKGKKPGSHMGNFFECIRDRGMPVSDVFTHHRAMTTCHLANISIRLDRKLAWDPKTEQITGDSEANEWLKRKARKGYEVTA